MQFLVTRKPSTGFNSTKLSLLVYTPINSYGDIFEIYNTFSYVIVVSVHRVYRFWQLYTTMLVDIAYVSLAVREAVPLH